jgi:hypothetical protein
VSPTAFLDPIRFAAGVWLLSEAQTEELAAISAPLESEATTESAIRVMEAASAFIRANVDAQDLARTAARIRAWRVARSAVHRGGRELGPDAGAVRDFRDLRGARKLRASRPKANSLSCRYMPDYIRGLPHRQRAFLLGRIWGVSEEWLKNQQLPVPALLEMTHFNLNVYENLRTRLVEAGVPETLIFETEEGSRESLPGK